MRNVVGRQVLAFKLSSVICVDGQDNWLEKWSKIDLFDMQESNISWA